MKSKLLSVALLAITSLSFAQEKVSFWTKSSNKNVTILERRLELPEKNLLELDVDGMKATLLTSPKRDLNLKSTTIVSLPNSDGEMELFRIYENSNMDPSLAERFPEIKSYIGIGVDNPAMTAYFSMSPLGFKSMVIGPDRSAVFIEPFSQDLKTYSVYKKADKAKSFSPFECSIVDHASSSIEDLALRPNADDSILRTFRLALSVTGEYTTYFGGTKALALAAMNNSLTRVNGVFERDFAVRMVLIANNDAVIYTNASTDPYSPAANLSNWNSQLQSTLTSVIGESKYDVGHLFGGSGGGGNAGCIGCVCVNGSKGSAYTSPSNGVPSGDVFDIDYVAHEFGHQFGANHTFSMENEGTGVNMEPGSGSTIMSYAGITDFNVQMNSDAYFHAISIQQVTNNVKTKTCQVNTPTGNAVPVVNAGLNYTIPKSTPFLLTGTASDANGNTLTYNWEQIDNAASNATGANSVASATRTSGPTFRSYNSSASPLRYFPNMSRVLAGATTTSGTNIVVEALPSVARTMNFRLTVLDNRPNGSANNSDDMVVTVNGTAGPFVVTSPNTVVSYVGGSTKNITWSVAGTTANGVNCANVDILISTNGGSTWTLLIPSTPNDGSQAVMIPNTPGTNNRIMVRGTNHIFFDVSNTNFTITAGVSDTTPPSAPTLSASATTQTTTKLTWSASTDNAAVVGYNLYRGTTLISSNAVSPFTVTGLTPFTNYSFTVRAKDAAGNISASSNTVNIKTLAVVIDVNAPTAPVLSASGITQTVTKLNWSGATDNVGVTGYNVYRGTTLIGSATSTNYTVTGLTPFTTYTFFVRAKDAAGNISPNSNVVTVKTLAYSTLSYCAASASSTADEKIGRVKVGTIDHPSTGTAGYENFTSISTNLVRGSNNTITITPFWTGNPYPEAYRVYIDYNRDGDFVDAGENVYSQAPTLFTPVSGTFTVPTTVSLGTTRMRVIMRYNTIPTTPCGTIDFGQVEDYTVNITSTARPESEATNNQISFSLYPNPVSGDILNISNLEAESSYKIYNMMGQELGKGIIENESINVGNLATGTYLIEVSNANGATSKRFIKQ